MEEGRIVRWLVAEGDRVASGQAIVEIETDKAVAEVEAPAAGTIRRLAQEGAAVAVEAPLAEIIDEAAPVAAPPSGLAPPTDRPPPADAEMRGRTAPVPSATEAGGERKHRGSPAARRIASERGLDLRQVTGCGPAGRIMARDLQPLAPAAKPALRQAVVAQLKASWRDIPHIHIAGELDGSGLAAAKQSAPVGITITDLLIVATVRALRAVPELNGTLGAPSQRVHLALAVAMPGGVVAPVIRNAGDLSIEEIARERTRLVTAARAGTPDPRDLAGGTFTLTNLGGLPVDFFAPVVSGPQVATLATGRLTEKPVVTDGKISVAHRIWANIAIDHRGADGIAGGRFLAALERCMNDLPKQFGGRP
jgi:pyruvate dehydrogenase E2 component (dihydrolipoamide acetyltransferase)